MGKPGLLKNPSQGLTGCTARPGGEKNGLGGKATAPDPPVTLDREPGASPPHPHFQAGRGWEQGRGQANHS